MKAGCALVALVVLGLPAAAQPARPTACPGATYDCALAQVGRREFAPAIGVLETLVAAEPGNLKARNLLGIALTGAGRIDEANRRFREALAQDPAFTPALKNMAINEFDLGRFADSRGHLEEVLKRAPGDAIAHLYLAEIHYHEKRLPAALGHYEKTAGQFAQNPAWTLHYARCLLAERRLPDALPVLDRLPEKDGASLFEAGVALGQAGAYADAARFFARARPSYKDRYAAGYNQTLMLIEAGDHAGAIRVAEEVMAQGTKPAELYNLAARAYLGARRIEAAYEALRTATQLEPAMEVNYVDLAMICVDHENFDLGLEIVDIGLRHLPESWLLYLQRGVLLAMKGVVTQAEAEFDMARRLAPEGPVPHVALAMAWMQTGQTPKAVAALRERARLDPKHPLILYTLGVALVRSGADPEAADGAEAIAAFEGALRLNPDFSEARAELGKLLLKRGDLARGIAELEKAAALDPGNVGAAYALGQAYRRNGQGAKAAEMLARFTRLKERDQEPEPGDGLKRMVVRIVREGTAAPQPTRTP